jgi:hypothetical protein
MAVVALRGLSIRVPPNVIATLARCHFNGLRGPPVAGAPNATHEGIRLYRLVPPAPETLHDYKRGSTGNIRDLIRSYRSILNLPPNSAPNVRYESMIGDWEAGSLGLVELMKLNMGLRRRLNAYHSAKGFIESLGLVWPAKYVQTPGTMRFLQASQRMSMWFIVEGPIQWVVRCCCIANSVLEAGFSSKEFDLACIHGKL